MKNILKVALISAVLLTAACRSEKTSTFTVTGEIENVEDDYLILFFKSNLDGSTTTIAVDTLKNGRFEFSASAETGVQYHVIAPHVGIFPSMAMARHTIAQYAEAIKYYELSYKYNPQNISALSSIGYCYERLKNYTKALEYYERYLKLGKPGTEGYRFVELSINYVKQEKFMEE